MKICFLLGLGLLVRLPSLGLFPDRDEGETATLAEQWLDHGRIPYRDYLEQKPPLAIVMNMAAFQLGGRQMFSVRLAALAWQAAALLVFFLLMENLAGPSTAFWSALMLVLAASSTALQGLAAGTETWMLLPMAAAVAVLASPPRPPLPGGTGEGGPPLVPSRWFAAGLYLGLACLAKQSAFPALLFFPFAAPGGVGEKAKAAAWLWLGAALPLAAVAAWFAQMGAFGDLWNCLVSYGFVYAGQGMDGFGTRLYAVLRHLAPGQGALWIMALLGLLGIRRSRQDAFALAALWLLSAAAGAALSGRFYPHYFIPLAPPLAALAGFWLASPLGGFRDPEFSLWGRSCRLALAAFFMAAWVRASLPLWTAVDGPELMRRQYGVESMAQAPAAAAILDQVDPSKGRLWIWGSEAELFFLSHRQPATRFLFHYPFTGESAPWAGGEAEMVSALRDPGVTAVVMAAALDPGNPFQATLVDELSLHFREAARGPGFMVAVRKNPLHAPKK